MEIWLLGKIEPIWYCAAIPADIWERTILALDWGYKGYQVLFYNPSNRAQRVYRNLQLKQKELTMMFVLNINQAEFKRTIASDLCTEYPAYPNSDAVYVFSTGVVWIVDGTSVYGCVVD